MTHGHQNPLRQRLLSLLDHTQPEQGTVGSEQSKHEFVIEKREIISESWMCSKQGIQKSSFFFLFAFYEIYGRNLMDTGVSFTVTGHLLSTK